MKIKLTTTLLFLSFLIYAQNQNKPWTRWWWMGTAVDETNITASLIDFQKAGLGGIEIQSIYGVNGYEDGEINFLSDRWVEIVAHTIKTADSLGMGVDLTLGTGWPFGGKQVELVNAASKFEHEQIYIEKGQKIDTIFSSKPEKLLTHVVVFDTHNKLLYKKEIKSEERFFYKAKNKDVIIYLIFLSKTLQKVKRAAPGAAGYTLDHFSKKALEQYLAPFDVAMEKLPKLPRVVFNDSFEVYDSNYTANFLEYFEQMRGYDLLEQIPLLVSETSSENGNRVKSDFRETLSDLLLNEFNRPWTNWANKKGIKTRLQAHGSPGNLIDLYASADIPECETFGSMPYDIKGFRREPQNIRAGDADPIMLKFSSSAAHITGKPLVSSESFTWLREHFKTALSQCKPEAEELLLNGVNHLFLHGSTYSPKDAVWPGWKFYASVNFNPNNSIWKDFDLFSSYIKNCQTLLQSGKPYGQVLLYWPIYDAWKKYHDGSLFYQFKIHSLEEWLKNTPFYSTANQLLNHGYMVDFISDEILHKASVENGKIILPGGTFESLVIPKTARLKKNTLEKLLSLHQKGGKVVFDGAPASVPGFHSFQKREKQLQNLVETNKSLFEPKPNIPDILKSMGVLGEAFSKSGLKFTVRTNDHRKLYYVVNHTGKDQDTFVPLNITSPYLSIYDPLTEKEGESQKKTIGNIAHYRIQIPSGGALFLKETTDRNLNPWVYEELMEEQLELNGNWQLKFLDHYKSIVENYDVTQLGSWTKLNEETALYSGTVSYSHTFHYDEESPNNWKLILGDVRESARIWLNGKYQGGLWANPFEMILEPLKKGKNTIVIEVTNLPVNRLIETDKMGTPWKIFKDINIVNRNYQKLDASDWSPVPSGLLNTPKMIKLH